MKVLKCPLNIESCISCRYAEGTGLRCTYSIDKPAVEKPASEDIMADAINGAIEKAIYNFECAMADIRKRDSFSQKEDNLSFAEARNKVINQLMGALYPLYKKKHAGEIVGLLPETDDVANKETQEGKWKQWGKNEVISEIKRAIEKWGKGE